jgi:hypothetical protein
MSETGRDGVSAWTQTRGKTGAFASIQRVWLPGPVVELTADGAERLGDLYWDQLERSSRGILRARRDAEGAREIRLVGIGPALLRFGRARYELTTTSVTCRYPIVGGLLVRMPGGSISFTQTVEGPVEVRSQVDDFFPRLATRRLRRGWNGLLYPHVQTRLHAVLGRRYFERLRTESR